MKGVEIDHSPQTAEESCKKLLAPFRSAKYFYIGFMLNQEEPLHLLSSSHILDLEHLLQQSKSFLSGDGKEGISHMLF